VNRAYNSKARRYAVDNRAESNCIRSGKSADEAEVTNNFKNALEVGLLYTVEAVYRHETSRGLSVTAEPLVKKLSAVFCPTAAKAGGGLRPRGFCPGGSLRVTVICTTRSGRQSISVDNNRTAIIHLYW